MFQTREHPLKSFSNQVIPEGTHPPRNPKEESYLQPKFRGKSAPDAHQGLRVKLERDGRGHAHEVSSCSQK